MPVPSYLKTDRGYDLAYNLSPGRENAPVVVFCGGFRSDMGGTKAMYLEETCQRAGLGFLRFDYSGHGQSGGVFAECLLSQWLQDAADVIALTGNADLVLVGSSMGGWVALRYLLANPDRIKAFIGIAAAPDFTRDLMAPSFTPAQKAELAAKNYLTVTSPYEPDESYILTQGLLDDGDALCLLDQTWEVAVPMYLLQGRRDREVPWHWPQRIANAFPEADVQISYIAQGDHRLSRPEDLGRLGALVTSCAYT